ncbi:DUF418 domain-containing protein [Jeotgalibacillus sp. S-D1]|uniref:DUF418 domain-containing protein n=1 Tax=Jeotgalibacillus sp. S-D1 TaxID=2552189 RepID=UPI00105A43CC|nr:DUF418 domain-containing protein [Jeotgalibacillus sp. S-D1]TDL32876.1 DUF418 domain-containing protein [Jeotgalibacillus sp. S-D1]
MNPTINKERMNVIDLIRGFALIGLPFVNVLALWRTNVNLSGTQQDILVQRFLYLFVEGRFYAIFSFLLGLGFWIFLSRAKEKSDHSSALFIRRMLVLFVVGVLHHLIYPEETLLIYAIMGLPVFFLDKAPKQINLMVGIAGIIIASFIGNKFLAIFPFILLGLAFGQYRVFEYCIKNRKTWTMVAVISFVATSILAVFLWQQAPDNGSVKRMEGYELSEAQIDSNVAFYEFTELSLAFAPVFSVCYVSFLVLLEPLFGRMLSPLNAFGRMAFTNYIGQTIILIIIAMFIPVNKVIPYTTATITCLLVVILQVIASSYWLKYFKYGPLEWLWRCGTYGRWLSIRS